MNRERLLNGLLFIAAGTLLLANTMGFLPWGFWLDVARFWPVILVLIGILVILRQRVPGLLVLVMIALIVLNVTRLPLEIIAGSGGRRFVFPPGSEEDYRFESGTADLSQEIEAGIESTDVTLSLGAGNIEVTGGATNLLDASLDYIGDVPQMIYNRSGNKASVTLKGGLAGRRGGQSPRWLVRLNESMPVSLSIDAGAGRVNMDFSTVRLASLDMDMGAGEFRIKFGDHGSRTDVSIDTGASNIVLVVPKEVGLRVKVSSAASGGNLSSSGLKKTNGYWVSDNYGSTKSTVEARISSAVARLTVERP